KRLEARDEVNALVIAWVESLDREEVMRRCLDAEVPSGKVNSIADIFEDEHFRERGTLATVDVPGVGEVTVPNVLPILSETPGRVSGLGPALGDSTVSVLRELLGLSAEDIADLETRGII
ncbi:MAG: CoA transferase, partial [Woeseiaceae bacterium]|nr:CoA transferase [Woeseiaceae bacterium]